MNKKPRIYLKENFVLEPDKLLQEIKMKVVWDERMKSRKTASFGVSYNYSGIIYPQTEMLEFLLPFCESIEKELNFYPNNCLLNFYADGNSSMGFHSDSSEELAENTGVAIISVGDERVIKYKNKANKNLQVEYLLKSGALLYMRNNVQQKWLHAIPKQESVGERISLTFRNVKK